MTKLLIAPLGALLIGSSSLLATVTLQFSTTNDKLTNIQNAAGNAAGGLSWGVIVSTTDATFAGGGTQYDGFTMPTSGNTVQLFVNSLATDDYFYFGGNTTNASLSGTDGGPNGITTLSSMPFTNNMTAGDPFALMWLDSNSANGSKYGFLTVGSGGTVPFVLPSDGATTPYSTNFTGADPVRLANNTFGSASLAPEPSRALLLGFGALGLLVRRRRA